MNQREIEIRDIAYSIWEQEGRPAGRETAHWLKAEAIWEEKRRQASPSVPALPTVGSKRPDARSGRQAKGTRSSTR